MDLLNELDKCKKFLKSGNIRRPYTSSEWRYVLNLGQRREFVGPPSIRNFVYLVVNNGDRGDDTKTLLHNREWNVG